MKKVFVATLVLCFAAAAANATVTWTATYLGSYPVQDGAATVDAWNLTFTSDSDQITGVAFNLVEPGYQVGAPANPPIQPLPTLTPTLDVASFLPSPPLFEADCHFNLLTADFAPAIVAPAETNDFSFGPFSSGWTEGLGGLTVQAGISTTVAGPTLDLVNLGWLSGTVSGITDVAGGTHLASAVIGEKSGAEYAFEFYVPEPATLSLLAIGGLALIRRRRS